MLKLVISLLCILLASCSSQRFSLGKIVFDREILPSCYVDLGDDYWSWRDSKGISVNVGEDLKSLLHSGVFDSELLGLNYEELEIALCDKQFLLSSKLAMVMNFYGRNVHPKDLYYHSLNRISKLEEGGLIELPVLIKILSSSLQELEERFE